MANEHSRSRGAEKTRDMKKAHQAQFDRLAGIDERSLGLLGSLGADKQCAQEREQQGDAKDAHGWTRAQQFAAKHVFVELARVWGRRI